MRLVTLHDSLMTRPRLSVHIGVMILLLTLLIPIDALACAWPAHKIWGWFCARQWGSTSLATWFGCAMIFLVGRAALACGKEADREEPEEPNAEQLLRQAGRALRASSLQLSAGALLVGIAYVCHVIAGAF